MAGSNTNYGKVAASLTIIAIFLVSSFCVSAAQQQLQQQSSPSHPLQTNKPLALITGAGVAQQEWNLGGWNNQNDSSTISTRANVMQYIELSPGVYLREISEDLQLEVSDVQYHVWTLAKQGQVEDFRSGRFRRFFAAGMYQEMEKKVISLLRQETPSRILMLLLSHSQSVPHKRLAVELGLSSQALTWQMGRLKALGIVDSQWNGAGKSYYLLEDAALVLIKYLPLHQ